MNLWNSLGKRALEIHLLTIFKSETNSFLDIEEINGYGVQKSGTGVKDQT